MIYVCQGHELGIGLEIFLKSFLLLSKDDQKKFHLAVNKDTLFDNLKNINLNYSQLSNLNVHFLPDSPTPQSTLSLEWCLSKISPKDILITLPTSKNQLIFNGVNKAGYTEYFRSYFNTKSISMVFKSFDENVLLITDHVPLKDVASTITEDLIMSKTQIAIDGFQKYFFAIKEILLAGINPHSGENGVLGNEEIVLNTIPALISKKFKINCTSFLSGDTLHFHQKKNEKQLLIYMFHDQGLSKFKAQNGLIGLNITMGLPFLRLSVDHGTAFDLFGKNKAGLTGMIYLLKTAIEVNNNVDK